MGPLLLSLQILPQVTSATTSTMSLLSSASNILHYGIQGDIPIEWGVATFVIGILGGLTGRNLALFLVQRYHRASITIFALDGVLCISILLLIYDIVVVEDDFSLHNFCAES